MRRAAFLISAAALLALAAVAIGATRDEHKFKMTFTADQVDKPTGLKFVTDRSDYEPPPLGQPVEYRVTKVVFTLANGSTIKPGVVPACSKSKLESKGPSACPDKSEIGDGKAIAITGIEQVDPVEEDVTLFAQRDGILAYLTGAQDLVLPLKVKGRKITAKLPRICVIGPDGDGCEQNAEAVLKKLTAKVDKTKTKKGALIRTPDTCPAGGEWTNKAKYTYSTGDAETEQATSRCRR
jgi:hypothetical protein